jgi:hypothetical protein
MRSYFLLVIFLLLGCCESPDDHKNAVKFTYDGNIKIEACINDSIKGMFILDTGADGLYLDSTFISQHPDIILKSDTAYIGGAGNAGAQKMVIVTNPVLVAVGNQRMTFDTVPVFDLESVNNVPIAGIIGNEFIQNKILVIDNEDSTLALDTLIRSKDYQTRIPFDYQDGRIYLKTQVKLSNGKTVNLKLMMDLGCTDALILNTPVYNKLKPDIRNWIDYSVLDEGVSGNSDGGEFRADQIRIGNIQVNKPLICFSLDTAGAHASDQYDGLLGNGIFDRFNYAIDYRNSLLYLQSNRNFNRSFNSTASGLYLVKEGKVGIVKCIYKQFEPFKQGLNIGDTIISINGMNSSVLNQKQIDDLFKKEGGVITLVKLQSGRHQSIRFKTGVKL